MRGRAVAGCFGGGQAAQVGLSLDVQVGGGYPDRSTPVRHGLADELDSGARAAENAWAEFVPFLQFDAEIRQTVCTTTRSSR